jgi:hypothetical protein
LKLNNGAIALVPEVIDLSDMSNARSETIQTIKGIVSASDHQIDGSKYYQETQQIIQPLKDRNAYPS